MKFRNRWARRVGAPVSSSPTSSGRRHAERMHRSSHVVAELGQHLIVSVDAKQALARVFEVDDDVERDHRRENEPQDVRPAPAERLAMP